MKTDSSALSLVSGINVITYKLFPLKPFNLNLYNLCGNVWLFPFSCATVHPCAALLSRTLSD